MGESFFGSGCHRYSAGSSATSSSYPISLVRAWCMLCFIDHQVVDMPPTSSPKPRIAMQKGERPCT